MIFLKRYIRYITGHCVEYKILHINRLVIIITKDDILHRNVTVMRYYNRVSRIDSSLSLFRENTSYYIIKQELSVGVFNHGICYSVTDNKKDNYLKLSVRYFDKPEHYRDHKIILKNEIIYRKIYYSIKNTLHNNCVLL